jgi:peptidoglycan/xylan/chitin deacetylase (PgdA/CDA1 family)
MKRVLQIAVHEFHRRLLAPNLPDQLAICFHAVEEGHHKRFVECLGFLKSEGYRFDNASEFVKESNDRRAFISFDDNFKSWLELLDTLARLDVRATFYVNTLPFRDLADGAAIDAYFKRVKHGGERETLTTAELRLLGEAGHVIGSHSHSHFVLPDMDPIKAKWEIKASKAVLEDLLANVVMDFSYPYGMRRHFNNELRQYCLELGFQTISTAIPGLQHQRQRHDWINRTPWDLRMDFAHNLAGLCIDGQLFERLTGRSAVSFSH